MSDDLFFHVSHHSSAADQTSFLTAYAGRTSKTFSAKQVQSSAQMSRWVRMPDRAATELSFSQLQKTQAVQSTCSTDTRGRPGYSRFDLIDYRPTSIILWEVSWLPQALRGRFLVPSRHLLGRRRSVRHTGAIP